MAAITDHFFRRASMHPSRLDLGSIIAKKYKIDN